MSMVVLLARMLTQPWNQTPHVTSRSLLCPLIRPAALTAQAFVDLNWLDAQLATTALALGKDAVDVRDVFGYGSYQTRQDASSRNVDLVRALTEEGATVRTFNTAAGGLVCMPAVSMAVDMVHACAIRGDVDNGVPLSAAAPLLALRPSSAGRGSGGAGGGNGAAAASSLARPPLLDDPHHGVNLKPTAVVIGVLGSPMYLPAVVRATQHGRLSAIVTTDDAWARLTGAIRDDLRGVVVRVPLEAALEGMITSLAAFRAGAMPAVELARALAAAIVAHVGRGHSLTGTELAMLLTHARLLKDLRKLNITLRQLAVAYPELFAVRPGSDGRWSASVRAAPAVVPVLPKGMVGAGAGTTTAAAAPQKGRGHQQPQQQQQHRQPHRPAVVPGGVSAAPTVSVAGGTTSGSVAAQTTAAVTAAASPAAATAAPVAAAASISDAAPVASAVVASSAATVPADGATGTASAVVTGSGPVADVVTSAVRTDEVVVVAVAPPTAPVAAIAAAAEVREAATLGGPLSGLSPTEEQEAVAAASPSDVTSSSIDGSGGGGSSVSVEASALPPQPPVAAGQTASSPAKQRKPRKAAVPSTGAAAATEATVVDGSVPPQSTTAQRPRRKTAAAAAPAGADVLDVHSPSEGVEAASKPQKRSPKKVTPSSSPKKVTPSSSGAAAEAATAAPASGPVSFSSSTSKKSRRAAATAAAQPAAAATPEPLIPHPTLTAAAIMDTADLFVRPDVDDSRSSPRSDGTGVSGADATPVGGADGGDSGALPVVVTAVAAVTSATAASDFGINYRGLV